VCWIWPPLAYTGFGFSDRGLRTGRPQSEIKEGGDFFGTLYQEPERLREFLRAMSALSTGAAMAIAEKFPWDGYRHSSTSVARRARYRCRWRLEIII